MCPQDPGPVGECARFLITPAPENLVSSLLGQRGQLLGGTRLADARFPGKHYYAALSGPGFLKDGGKLCRLPPAADEGSTKWPCVDGGLTGLG